MNYQQPSNNSMCSMPYDPNTMPRINDVLCNNSSTSTPINNQYYETSYHNTMSNDDIPNNLSNNNTPKSCISSSGISSGMPYERDNYMNRDIDFTFDGSFGSMYPYDKYDNINGHNNNTYNNNNIPNNNNNILPLTQPVYSNNNSNSSANTSVNTSAISSCRSSIDESVYNDNNNVNVTISNVNIYNNTDHLNVMPQITNKFNFKTYDDNNINANNNNYDSQMYNYNTTNNINNNPHNGEYIQQNEPTNTTRCNNNCYSGGCTCNTNFTVCDLPKRQPDNIVNNNNNNIKLLSLVSPNKNPFIKNNNNNNFVYPTYKQKYASPYSHNKIDIKNEIYRHRHDRNENRNNNEQIKVKIKGNNFESLVSRLTYSGDNTRCIECKRTFYQKCHLFRHIRDIHLICNKSGIHSCPFCIKTFHQKSNLDTHCMTHAKDRKFSHPFKCIICINNGKDKCFTRKSSLKRHCQTKHKNVSIDAEWINKQQTPKWNPILKTFVFNPVKNKININKISQMQLQNKSKNYKENIQIKNHNIYKGNNNINNYNTKSSIVTPLKYL